MPETGDRKAEAVGLFTAQFLLQDNIARGKADIDAKAQLAGQVNTTMKQVAGYPAGFLISGVTGSTICSSNLKTPPYEKI